MEFCAEFAVLQGTLIGVQRNFGSLNEVTKDDADKIAAAIEATKKVLHKFNEGNSVEETGKCLRKVSMFLILNSDLSIRDGLMDDMNCGHVVGCTPVMSMNLLIQLVWGLSLQEYFYETIMYSPPPLGIELLDAAVHAIKCLPPKVALQAVYELCSSAYVRALTLPSNQDNLQIALNQLFAQFKILLSNFMASNAESLMDLSKEELHVYSGQALEILLDLLNFCLSRYLTREPYRKFSQVYDLVCPWDTSKYFVEKCEEQITVDDFNKELLSVCKSNLNHVTVDEWLEWVEFIADSDSTKTQQCILAEKMYICKESMHALKQPEELVTELTAMLASMARKPRDEDDDIREAGLEEIVKNVSDPNMSREKWFKALVGLDEVVKNEQSLCCLESNLDLMDSAEAEIILHLILSQLELESDSAQCDRLKCLASSVVQHVDVDTQIKILEHFLEKMGSENTILLTRYFKDKATEALNKAIGTSKEIDKFLSDCTCLCLESPCQVLELLLAAGISNSSQGRMVVRVLGRLGVVCGLPSGDSSDGLLLQSISNLMAQHQDWSDSQRENFTHFVTALAKQRILDSSVFVQKFLLPALHTSLVNKCWRSVMLWLQTAQLLVKSARCELNNACLVVIMAQVIEASQWNVFTFSMEAVHIHEEAVNFLDVLFDTLDVSGDSEVKWVQSKMLPLSAHVWSYLSKMYNPWANNSSRLCDLSLILLYLAHGRNDHAITMLQTSKYSRLEWILALVEVIPKLTTGEWDLLAKNLALLNPGPLFVFHLLSDAVLFVFVAVAKTKTRSIVSCIEYITRNFGAFVKNHMLPIMSADSLESAVQVFDKCIQLLSLLPAAIEESTTLQFSNILVEIISYIMCSGDVYTQRITTSIEKLHDGEMKRALSLKLQMKHAESDLSDEN